MKKSLLILALILCSASLFAVDIIGIWMNQEEMDDKTVVSYLWFKEDGSGEREIGGDINDTFTYILTEDGIDITWDYDGMGTYYYLDENPDGSITLGVPIGNGLATWEWVRIE